VENVSKTKKTAADTSQYCRKASAESLGPSDHHPSPIGENERSVEALS